MNRRWLPWAACLLTPVGCMSQQTRLQSGDTDDARDRAGLVRTIGDISAIDNAQGIVVAGVGLVVGLGGTGGSPPGPERTKMEDILRKKGFDNVRQVLDSPNHAVVRVTAVVPPGALRGDTIDVDVTLPPGSRATSLRGGTLAECQLYNFDSARNVSEQYAKSGKGDQFLLGDALVKAEGPMIVGLDTDPGDAGDEAESAARRRGRVWGGGRVMADRPFYLTLTQEKYQLARVAARVADRINETFPGPKQGPGAVATAHNKELISLRVPAHYKHNKSRFIRVVRMVPMDDTPGPDSDYRKLLEEQLLDPAKTITAALRLEALGNDSTAALKPALQSASPLVRFAAAEALAYLGQPAGGEELARLAAERPPLRAYALTALAALNEAVSNVKLKELLAADDPALRYGAFRALRVMDESDPLVAGEPLNKKAFWLHRVGGDAPGMVHVSGGRRAEVVLFGKEPKLVPPFSIQAGPEITVTASKGDDTCTISRFSMKKGVKRVQSGLDLGDVLKQLGELGGGYADAVDLLRQAERAGGLDSALATDALPQAASVYELAKLGRDDPNLQDATAPDDPRDGPGETPNLFERAGRPPADADADDERSLRRRRKSGEAAARAERPTKKDAPATR
jgi:hypothetical protein